MHQMHGLSIFFHFEGSGTLPLIAPAFRARTASVRALDTVQCLGIDRWVFLSQLERQPQVTIKMLQILAQRLRDSDARFVE